MRLNKRVISKRKPIFTLITIASFLCNDIQTDSADSLQDAGPFLKGTWWSDLTRKSDKANSIRVLGNFQSK